MFKITEDYRLCQKLNGLHKTQGSCFQYSIKECNGACIKEEPPKDYNERVQQFLDEKSYKNQHMLIIDRGRDVEERSVVLIEDGQYKGFGYFSLNHQITNPDILKTLINPMQNNRDVQHIIQNYLRKNKKVKTVKLD